MSSYRTIKIKKYHDIILEKVAAGAILPGSLVELNSDDKVVVNTVTGGHVPTMFALEDELQGNSTRDSYASDDPVQIMYAGPGEVVLAVIDSGLDPAIGALLEAGASGQLVAASAGTAQFQVVGAKVVDDDDNHRVPVRII